MDYPYNLGPYSRKVTVESEEAQRWFDRGLNLCFGYHHEEAVACFEKALADRPNCAMAPWGSSGRDDVRARSDERWARTLKRAVEQGEPKRAGPPKGNGSPRVYR